MTASSLDGAGPERLESLVGELDAPRANDEISTPARPWCEDRVVEGANEELGVLQRHQSETGQSMRRLRDVFGDQTVRLASTPTRPSLAGAPG